MKIKLLTEHHLQFLSLKEVAQACLSLHLSKCHIVGNHMSRLKCLENEAEINEWSDQPEQIDQCLLCQSMDSILSNKFIIVK